MKHRSFPALLAVLLGAALLGAACQADARERASGAVGSARCMADGTTSVLGKRSATARRDAGRDLGELGSVASTKASELRDALDDCIDVRATLTGALVAAGLSDSKASCVADRALQDDNVLGPLLVSMVFGDPGIGTAVAVAVRAGGPCIDADDLARVLPG